MFKLSRLACKDSHQLRDFFDFLSINKFHVTMLILNIISVRCPFLGSRIGIGLFVFYSLFITDLLETLPQAEVAETFCRHYPSFETCSFETLPLEYKERMECRPQPKDTMILVPWKMAIHLLKSHTIHPYRGYCAFTTADIPDILYGMWKQEQEYVWKRRDDTILRDLFLTNPCISSFEDERRAISDLKYPSRGLYFLFRDINKTTEDEQKSSEWLLENRIILPLVEEFEPKFASNSHTFQCKPLSNTGTFALDYLPLLPKCFRKPIEDCFTHRRHLLHEFRFPIFSYLFGIGIPFSVVEELWISMVSQSTQGSSKAGQRVEELKPIPKQIHAKWLGYWSSKTNNYFSGKCEVISQKIGCPYKSADLPDIEDIHKKSCMSDCGFDSQNARKIDGVMLWDPIRACKSLSTN